LELERQIVEGEIKRKTIQQEVARLKRKILVKHGGDRGGVTGNTANNSGSSSDVEDSGSSDDAEAEPHRRRSHHQRQRPRGLSYKLRDTTSRATVQRYIGRKGEQLDNCLTQVVGNGDSWQRVFGGDGGEEAGDRSEDRERRRGEQLREAGDLEPYDVRTAHTHPVSFWVLC
jgi:hypothetical protein